MPSYTDYGRFWDIVEKHKITPFYTASTTIRALAKKTPVNTRDLSSL
ncbi:MAG: acetyl-CoA synthetase [Nonlabens sp.]|jgi:acetyl-CoA synthetase